MGVFKWLRRERVTVSSHREPTPTSEGNIETIKTVGTIRTEEYKRDLAEFRARRSAGKNDLETPIKRKCSKNPLPVSCTSCAEDLDKTFNYEKKSGGKYKGKHRPKTAAPQDKFNETLPSIQFVFQNQVFMPGNVFTKTSFSEPRRQRRATARHNVTPERILQKHIDFKDDEEQVSPTFDKENSLPFDVKKFLDGSRSDEEEVDGVAAGDKVSLISSCSTSKDDSCRDKLVEVMSELKSFDQWADEQLRNNSKLEDNKSDSSSNDLPLVTRSDLDVSIEKERSWNNGKWGAVPVQTKKLIGVTLQQVKKSLCHEINILRKCRHPNVILLMGLYTDIYSDIHIICEKCEYTIYNMLHVQGRTLSVQTALRYALDIANALLFLRMRGYIHSELTSHSVMVTALDAAKLSDFGPCVQVGRKNDEKRVVDLYSPQPQYINIGNTVETSVDCEPLLSAHTSSVYLSTHAASKDYSLYRNSYHYRWHAPELFTPDPNSLVYPCSKSDVYSLCLILWETCNGEIPFKRLTYEELKDQYTIWNVGMGLPPDGSYPGSVLDLMKQGLTLTRQRPSLEEFAEILAKTKEKLEDVEYVIVPTRLSKKKSDFSSFGWDESPTISESISPINEIHQADVHGKDISTEKDITRSDDSALYETLRSDAMYAKTCFIPDDETDQINYNYCVTRSTPVSKVKAKIKEFETPGLHRTDSTEYCSILSPNYTTYNEKSPDATEKPATKLSRSLTPKSYKPLHIKVPEFNLDCLKSLPKEQAGRDRSSYNFDIKNYSLPSTPIARSNKLRRNAWLSGELSFSDSKKSNISSDIEGICMKTYRKDIVSIKHLSMQGSSITEANKTKSLLDSTENSPSPTDVDKDFHTEKDAMLRTRPEQSESCDQSPDCIDVVRDAFTGLRRTSAPPADFSSVESRERTRSWSFKSSRSERYDDTTSPDCQTSPQRVTTFKHPDMPFPDTLRHQDEGPDGTQCEKARGVKPLVAIHERWIMEARRKTVRSTSLPNDTRCNTPALKPASHCVDTLQKSLPQLHTKQPFSKFFRGNSTITTNGRNGTQSESFIQAREMITKSLKLAAKDSDINSKTWRKDDKCDKSVNSEPVDRPIPTVNKSTDTGSIEDFIRDLIRKEFHQLLQEMTDDKSSVESNEHILNKGLENVMNILEPSAEESRNITNGVSKFKINGNNRPLVQISFSNSGENSMQIVDNCLNVTVCDNKLQDKLNQSFGESICDAQDHTHSLKRCQTFSAIQEARSTEDLYIDDELSTQMQESFGGRVKLIPLHGSIHEILCDKEDDCCLQKVKQENCCDVMYFRCDNSDTESRDAVDGRDTLVFKRSISLIQESVQLASNRGRRPSRPSSEIHFRKLTQDLRNISRSTPTLKNDDTLTNAHNSSENSSSDEYVNSNMDSEEFEQLEGEIEAQLSRTCSTYISCAMDKISEESLSAIKEESSEKEDSG